MGPPESVQTIFTQNFQHIGKLFNFLVQPLLNLSVPHILWDTQKLSYHPYNCSPKNVQKFKKNFIHIIVTACFLYEILHHFSIIFPQLANYQISIVPTLTNLLVPKAYPMLTPSYRENGQLQFEPGPFGPVAYFSCKMALASDRLLAITT